MHIANAVVAVTGLVYAWMLYFVVPDPATFSVVNHPWQPTVQHAHVLAAPFLVFAIGVFWWSHALRHYSKGMREGLRSGLSMMGLAMPMVVSGYALQVSIEEFWRTLWTALHVSTSLLWIGAFIVHWLVHRLNGWRVR